jgi:Ca-activated chloride channel family protein
MTFQPALPVAVLVVVSLLILLTWALSLQRALRRAGRSRYLPVALRWSGLAAAMLLLVIAAARPSFGTPRDVAADGGINVYFVVDRSVASRVEDFGDGKSRMAGMRRDMAALIDQYPNARFAVITFASASDLDWPLSQDVWSLGPKVSGMSAYAASSPDTLFDVNAAAGADLVKYELQQSADQFPAAKNLVFYFGSGAAGSRAPQGKFDMAGERISGGAVLGYGTPAGGPIPGEVRNGRLTYLTDAGSDAPLQSGIDEARLRGIADQLKLPYIHRLSGEPLSASLPAGTANAGSTPSSEGDHVELYWIFALAAAVLTLPEIFLTIRHYRRNRVVRQEVDQ